MTVDYNLIVVGGSVTARYAAELARRWRARVALVEPPFAPLVMPDWPLLSSETEAIALQAVQQSPFSDWQQSCGWGQTVVQHQLQQRARDTLAMQGVDVVMGTAEFARRNRELGLWVKAGSGAGDRWLRAHSYLLCPGSVPTLLPIAGLIDVPFLTLDDVLALKPGQTAPALDGHSLIVGRSPRSIELAQAMARHGKHVTLLVAADQFAATWDRDVAQLLLAHLEAAGVNVLSGAEALQAKWIDQRVWIQTPNQAIAADHLIFATRRQPLLGSLNLGAAKIELQHSYAPVSHTLKTSHRCIYGCGDAIAAGWAPNQIRFQAEVAVRNALFWPPRTHQSRPVPVQLNTEPAAVQVGLTETKARQTWGDRLRVLRAEIGSTDRAAIEHCSSGFCKLLLSPSGKLLGAHAVGGEAGEWIGAIAVAIQEGIPFRQLAAIHSPSATFAELLNQLVLDWETQALRHNRLQLNLLELMMNWRRDWS